MHFPLDDNLEARNIEIAHFSIHQEFPRTLASFDHQKGIRRRELMGKRNGSRLLTPASPLQATRYLLIFDFSHVNLFVCHANIKVERIERENETFFFIKLMSLNAHALNLIIKILFIWSHKTRATHSVFG
jgi:hypothetical protein